jgi:hypothetical protein
VKTLKINAQAAIFLMGSNVPGNKSRNWQVEFYQIKSFYTSSETNFSVARQFTE